MTDVTLRLALGGALEPVFWLNFALAASTLLMVLAFARDERGRR
jgi:hypothetical protein